MPRTSVITPEKFTTFGELLRFLRRKADLTQRELSIAVGYSESQISRLEQNERAPEEATLAARFVPALYIEDEPQWIARLIELGAATHSHASGADAFQPIAEAKPTLHNLPIQLTSFIGREKEIIEVKQHILNSRLVTLTGSGGCGKTRLALQSAFGSLDVFPHGVWLIELAPLADPTLVLQTVVVVLGLKEELGRPLLSILTNHLRAKQVLLILDNCEHLVEASAQLTASLLHTCPGVHILATSREMLGVAGEISFLVPSLSSPDPLHSIQVDMLTQYESVQLFVDRAAMTLPGFAITKDNASAVAQVCQRLDGIPLAIELAAARVKLLRVEQIAERLDDRFQLLTGGERTALPRHQTLAALIDWSHELLTESERTLFRRLSVFAGGWTLEAAEAVCTSEGIESAGVLDLLTQLVNKSLIVAEREQGEEARYHMLETIRKYALEKLTSSGETDAVRQKHAIYYLALAEVIVPREQYDQLQPERDNLRAALRWSHAATGSAELELRLAWAMHEGLHKVQWSEMRGWLETALAHAEAERLDDPRLLARLLWTLGFGLGQHSDFVAGQERLSQSLRICQKLGDLEWSAEVLFWLGWTARESGDASTARLRLEESLTLWRELGDQAKIASALVTLGEVAVMQEETARATALIDESLVLFRQLGDSHGTAWAFNHLGHVAQLQGAYVRATRLHKESLVLLREIDPEYIGVPEANHSLGETALARGDAALAATHFKESLTLSRQIEVPKFQAWCLAGLAGVAALDEEPERAAWLWGAAEALRQSIGARPAPAARATHEQLQAEVRKQLGEAVFNAKWAEGQAASWEQAVDKALATT